MIYMVLEFGIHTRSHEYEWVSECMCADHITHYIYSKMCTDHITRMFWQPWCGRTSATPSYTQWRGSPTVLLMTSLLSPPWHPFKGEMQNMEETLCVTAQEDRNFNGTGWRRCVGSCGLIFSAINEIMVELTLAPIRGPNVKYRWNIDTLAPSTMHCAVWHPFKGQTRHARTKRCTFANSTIHCSVNLWG